MINEQKKLNNLKGFTFVEILIVAAICILMFSALFFILSVGEKGRLFSDIHIQLQEQARGAMAVLIKDIGLTDAVLARNVSVTDPQAGQDYEMLIIPTAKNANSDFQRDNYGYPVWQGVIVYYPYVTSSGIRQLRRYVSYGLYIFPVPADPIIVGITNSIITFDDSDGNPIVIDRANQANTLVLINNLGTEDADGDGILDSNENDGDLTVPLDNKDDFLDKGAHYEIIDRVINAKFFLSHQGSGGRGAIFILKSGAVAKQ